MLKKFCFVLSLLASQLAMGKVFIGPTAVDDGYGQPALGASTLFGVQSTTKGSLPCPSMTTTQKNAVVSPAAGACVYDNVLNQPFFYTGSWVGTLLNPMTTFGDIIYGGTLGAPTRLPIGTAGQVLTEQNPPASQPPAWQTISGNTNLLKAVTFQSFLNTNYFTFTVTAATETVGATYTNNSSTFTTVYTIAGGTTLVTFRSAGSNAPLASGTLTKATGTGDATITYSAQSAVGTYIPTSTNPLPLWLHVRLVGGGGGGAGSGTSGAGAGSDGGNSTFASPNQLASNGGVHAAAGFSGGGAGGTAVIANGASGMTLTGGVGGGAGENLGTSGGICAGGNGGVNALGGNGGGGNSSVASLAGAANTGAGGGGGGVNTTANDICGAGGGASGYADGIVTGLVSSYVFTVGAGGAGGGLGLNGFAGAAGGSGGIWIEEHYQ